MIERNEFDGITNEDLEALDTQSDEWDAKIVRELRRRDLVDMELARIDRFLSTR